MSATTISIKPIASRARGATTRIAFAVTGATAGVLLTVTTLHAQNPTSTPLTLGGAARLAADRSASTAAARAGSAQADFRVSQRRSELLPTLSTPAQIGTRSYATASLGLDVPTIDPTVK